MTATASISAPGPRSPCTAARGTALVENRPVRSVERRKVIGNAGGDASGGLAVQVLIHEVVDLGGALPPLGR